MLWRVASFPVFQEPLTAFDRHVFLFVLVAILAVPFEPLPSIL